MLRPLGLSFKRMMALVEREAGLSAPKWFVLVMLREKDGVSQAEVGERFEVDPSRVTRIVQSLEADGLVRRERDPEDNRAMRLYLTDGGRRRLRKQPQVNESLESRIREVLGEDEAEDLRRMLGALAEGLK